MLNDNIKFLRKKSGLSQEDLAEKMRVSRQSIAKWENGSTMPDVIKCVELSVIFNTTVDALVNYSFEKDAVNPQEEEGKYIFGIIEVDDAGKIEIPMQAREVFNISNGDKLILLGDVNKGMALSKVYFPIDDKK